VLRFFRKKEPEPLIFPSAADAFGHACLHQSYTVNPEAVIPALVVERGKAGEEGEVYFLIRLPSRGGGIEIWAPVLRGAKDYPSAGDLVGFRVVRVATEIPEPANIIGYIAYSFAPLFVDGKGWRITGNFIPDNLKPDIRF
jgi:hypothetical protein